MQAEVSVPSGQPNDALLAEVVLKWQEILVRVKPKNHSIEALLKGCKPLAVYDQVLHLEFFYPFHKEKIETAKSRAIVEDVLSQVLGKKVEIKCILGEKGVSKVERKERPKTPDKPKQDDLLSAANEIFGGEMVS